MSDEEGIWVASERGMRSKNGAVGVYGEDEDAAPKRSTTAEQQYKYLSDGISLYESDTFKSDVELEGFVQTFCSTA
jgi:hypothetical protein